MKVYRIDFWPPGDEEIVWRSTPEPYPKPPMLIMYKIFDDEAEALVSLREEKAGGSPPKMHAVKIKE